MSSPNASEVSIAEKYESIKPDLNERARRIWAATEAQAIGRGGGSEVARATGLSRTTLYHAINELNQSRHDLKGRVAGAIRQPGGGRKRLSETDPQWVKDVQKVVESSTRGDPESPLLWTSKSTTQLAEELQAMGHLVSQASVWRLLDEMDDSLQANRKVHEGDDVPERDEQFLQNVGIAHDTAQFAVESIRRWWYEMGSPLYPAAHRLLITADCGGSNGYRVRLWKLELQHLADETGLALEVCHFPPGTRKWNQIEHRMFCRISQN